jgi:hypothetical protein
MQGGALASTRNLIPDLVATIYDAAMEPGAWHEVATAASRAFDAPYVMLGVVDRHGHEVMRAATQGVRELNLAGYLSLETNPGIAFSALTPPASVELVNSLMPDSELERLPFYQDLLRPFDLWHTAVMNVHRDDVVLAPMGFLRARTQRAFDDAELGALRALAPHLRRALNVTLRLGETEARATALAENSDRALSAIVQTDAIFRIAEANALARAILGEADGLFARDGALRAARGDDNAKLLRLILEAAGGVDGLIFVRKSEAVQIARPSGRRSLGLIVSPTRSAASPFGRSHTVTIAFADPERAPEGDADLLARLHGFTPRESAVAALLIKGRSPREAADELAMSRTRFALISATSSIRPASSALRIS